MTGRGQIFRLPSIEDLGPVADSIVELPVMEGQWHFQKDDEAARKAPGFDESNWQVVNLPDTWQCHSDYAGDSD